MRVFISGYIAQKGIDLLKKNNVVLTHWHKKRQITVEELITACQQHDALISIGPNKIDASFLNACKHLKVIALHSVGFDQVDVKEAQRL